MSVATSAPQLDFLVTETSAVTDAVAPTIAFAVRIDAGGRELRSLALNVQVRIDATRRRYADGDEPRLLELFGGRERWGRTLRSLLWTTASLTVPRFSGQVEARVLVPATYDFDVLAAKYLNALAEGTVPVDLLFSGTAFYLDGGRLQATPIPWDREARAELPVAVWREALDAAFPGDAWLRVRRDVLDELWAFRAAEALPSWEATFGRLLGERRSP